MKIKLIYKIYGVQDGKIFAACNEAQFTEVEPFFTGPRDVFKIILIGRFPQNYHA